ncbi:MAG TPA: hypothetical protein DCS35_18465 [Vibrio sp.]|nr:hypothetical protein [Vibrio sp.]
MIELVDEQTIQQMIEDTSADVMPMLIDEYVDETQQRIHKIEHAFSNQDCALLEFESHALGSSALALGNRALSMLARKIEHLCMDDQQETALSYQEEFVLLANSSLNAIINRKQQGF